MLSVEKPLDPPCSPPKSEDDERVFVDDDGDADDHKQQEFPTFSIRDYVFTSRHKNIEKNWPFPQHHLQLFSKHEVKDVLPPFQPPDTVRKHCLRKSRPELVSQLLSKKAIVEVCCLDEERYSSQVPCSLHQQEKLTLKSGLSRQKGFGHAVEGSLIIDAQPERESGPSCKFFCSLQEDSSTISESPLDLQHSQHTLASQKNETTVGPSGRKCRLILKIGSISDSTHTTDITLSTTTMSDSMASKVCPVCKLFSSTSNTTLNAHIDQCLAVDSTSIGDVNESQLTPHKIKPRKKRSMVDIYATASRCTLEELDRRNGSNWAADLSSPGTAAKVNAGEKRQRQSGVDLEGTDDESPVYIDSNGKKILILSKISSASISSSSAAADGPNKLIKNGKKNKIISFDAKNRSERSKHHNLKSQNTKLCSLKADEARVSGAPEYRAERNFEKEESLSQFAKPQDVINSIELRTLRKSVGSKRTGLLKKVSDKDGHRGLGCSPSMTVSPSNERNSMYSGDSSPRVLSVLSNPSEKVVSSLKNLETGIPMHDTGCCLDSLTRLNPLLNDKTPSRRVGCLSKRPQSSGMVATSPRSKRVEVNVGQARNPDNLPKTVAPFQDHRIAMEGQQSCIPSDELVATPSFDTLKSKSYGKRSALKKPRVHRSMSKMEEKVRALPMNVEEQYECAENLSGTFKPEVIHNLNGSSDQVRPEVEKAIDQLSLGSAGELTSRTRREASRFMEEGEPKDLEEASCSDSQDHGSDVDGHSESNVRVSLRNLRNSENFIDDIDDLETDSEAVLDNEDTVTRTYLKKAVGVSILKSNKTLTSEFYNSANSMDALPNSLSSTQEHSTCACGMEKRIPLLQQKLCDSQLTYRANEVGRIGKNHDMASVINSQLVGISLDCKCTRCRNDPQYFPASVGTPFRSVWSMNFEDIQEKPSLSSSKMLCTEDRHLVVDRDYSESPVSATSSISHPVIARSDSRYLDVGSCAKPSEAEDKIRGLSVSCAEPMMRCATSSTSMVRAEGAERLSLDRESSKAITVSSTDDQPCHCLWRKSFSFGAGSAYQEPQLLKQRTQESSVNISNIGPEIFTKQDSFTVSRDSDMKASICESPRESVSMHSSPDAMHRLTRYENSSPVRAFSQTYDVEPTSNPVLSLRLMGKNLMVVNKDEERSVNLSQLPLGTSNACAGTKNTAPFGFYTGSVPNQDCFSSQIMSPKGSVVSDQGSCNSQPRCFNDDVSKSFTSHSGSETSQRPPQPLVVTQNKMDIGGVDYSLIWQGLKSCSNMQTQQKKHTRRLVAPAQLQYLNPVSAVQMVGHPTREVIVIDDSPESEAASGIINTKYAGGLKGNQPSPMGVLPPTSTYPNISQMSSFSCHPMLNPFSRMEPYIGTKPHFSVPHLGGAHAIPVKWGDTSISSGITLQNPFTSTSSLACHRNQAMYHFPSFP